jgi:hypothetical protein
MDTYTPDHVTAIRVERDKQNAVFITFQFDVLVLVLVIIERYPRHRESPYFCD